MAKTAYLYTFHPRTRVVADPNDFRCEEDIYEYITVKAREQMEKDLANYLNGENGEYEEDEECPYGTFDSEE